MDAVAFFRLSPDFQYFPLVHKTIFNVAFSDPSQTQTSKPSSIFQLIADCLPCEPLFSLGDFSTVFLCLVLCLLLLTVFFSHPFTSQDATSPRRAELGV